MKRQIKYMFRRWGQKLCLITNQGEGAEYYAFLQSLQYKNKMYLQDVRTPMGLSKQDYFLYIGPPDQPLTADSLVKSGGGLYKVIKSEPIYMGGEFLYIWAVVRKAVDENGAL